MNMHVHICRVYMLIVYVMCEKTLIVAVHCDYHAGTQVPAIVTEPVATDKRRTPREIKHRSLLPDSFHSDLVSTPACNYCCDITVCTM